MTKVCEEIIKKIDISDKERFKKCIKDSSFYAPLFVKIKPFGKCNLRCKKCNYWRKDSHMLHPGLAHEKIMSLIHELSQMGCKCIKLSGGEITLYPRVHELVAHIKSKGMICSITSNGTLIDENLAEKLVSAGLDKLTISIDSANPEIHNTIAGVKGAWDRSVNGVNQIMKFKKKFNSTLRITITSVINKLNYRDLDNILDLLANMNVNRLDLVSIVTGHLKNDELFMSEQDIDLFNSDVMSKIDSKAKKLNITIVNPDPFRHAIGLANQVPGEIYSKIPCYVGWYSFLIHFNGLMALCCANKEFVIGNVHKNKITDIVNSKASLVFRENQKGSNKPENCLKCMDEIYRNCAINEWLNKNETD